MTRMTDRTAGLRPCLRRTRSTIAEQLELENAIGRPLSNQISSLRIGRTMKPCWLVLLWFASGASCGAAQSPLSFVADVPLPGRAARFDYQSLDTASNRLYIAHMRGDQLVVVDVKLRKVVATVGDLPGATGVWAVPELHRVFVAVTGHHQVAVIDDRDLSIVARVGPVAFPDGIAYAPNQKKVYVSDEFGEAEMVIDAATNRQVSKIPLEGEAGNSKYDPTSGHILVAVQTKNDIAVIDPGTDRIVERFSYKGANHPHGMVVDESDGLLFVANQGSGNVSVLDLASHALLSEHDLGRSPDVLAFDARRHLLYVGAERGDLAVFRVQGKTVTSAGTLDVPHGHTVSVDPRDGLVYLPLENVQGKPVLRIMTPNR
jgi:DNA-binding beta-propeller fold protein YncE